MKKAFHISLRSVPLALLGPVFLLCAYRFFQGGMPRVYVWVFFVMGIIPVLGTVGVLWSGVSWAIRRQMAWLDWSGLGISVFASLFWGFAFGFYPIAFPAGDGNPELLVRPPMDGPILVGWGGEKVSQNYHAAFPEQRWAYDLLVEPTSVDSTNNEDFGCFGKPVYAPTAGEVIVSTRDAPDEVPGDVNHDREGTACGNTVVLKAAETGTYLQLCHLKEQSVQVNVGEFVEEGDPVGQCGNSGNTTEPHLHMHHVRNDPREVLFEDGLLNEALRLGFRSVDGPSHPTGGFEIEGEEARMLGDVIQYMSGE
jgi:hypothetical protein